MKKLLIGFVVGLSCAAVATVAGILHFDDCEASRPVPLLHIHGTADRIVPFDGSSSILTDEVISALAGSLRPIPEQVGEWVVDYGCDLAPEVTVVSDEVELRTYSGSAPGG